MEVSGQLRKQAIRDFIEAALNRGDLSVVDGLFAVDFVGHNAASPALIHGPEGVKHFIAGYRAAFSHIDCCIESQYAEGEAVVTRWRAGLTHTGALFGIPPTHQHGVVTGISINRFRGAQIVEAWDEWDMLGMMQQFGLIPALV
jgi:predicted ester cyclase